MANVTVSGSASGIGAATRARLEAEGAEPRARELAAGLSGDEVYPASKLALRVGCERMRRARNGSAKACASTLLRRA